MTLITQGLLGARLVTQGYGRVIVLVRGTVRIGARLATSLGLVATCTEPLASPAALAATVGVSATTRTRLALGATLATTFAAEAD